MCGTYSRNEMLFAHNNRYLVHCNDVKCRSSFLGNLFTVLTRFGIVIPASGAALPLLTVLVVPQSRLVLVESVVYLIVLAASGVLAARTGGAPVMRSVARVVFWGALAMGLTAGVGTLFGTVV